MMVYNTQNYWVLGLFLWKESKNPVILKLVRLIKMCLNETYRKVQTGKHMSDVFPIQNGLKQNVSLKLFFNLL
jgi:hypothetical protein